MASKHEGVVSLPPPSAESKAGYLSVCSIILIAFFNAISEIWW